MRKSRFIGILLEREGMTTNAKKLFRLYSEEGLSVRRRRGRASLVNFTLFLERGGRRMRRSRFNEEQSIGILKEHQAGLSAAELCRKHGVSRSSRKRSFTCSSACVIGEPTQPCTP